MVVEGVVYHAQDARAVDPRLGGLVPPVTRHGHDEGRRADHCDESGRRDRYHQRVARQEGGKRYSHSSVPARVSASRAIATRVLKFMPCHSLRMASPTCSRQSCTRT